MSEQQSLEGYDFASGHQFMDAIRSSGYKNVAMAIGELVDNAIQANATDIDILVSERPYTPSERTVRRVEEIAVLDNGKGMDVDLLRRSLRLGYGTHVDDKDGIGKFGVGLPQASVSQAKRIDVWTWQDGIANVRHTYIDLDNEQWVEDMEIPAPTGKSIPEQWQEMASFDQESGTLVTWSKVDRCDWKRGRTIYRHSQDLIGRMYRNWLHPNTDYPDVDISLKLYDETSGEVDKVWDFVPNDPMYLMDNTSVELPEGIPDPPFEQFGEPVEKKFEVRQRGGKVTEETVKMTFSISKPETRKKVDGRDAGHASHGKHAKENIGLSIVREGRELTLDKNWASKDPRNRWWGAQIEFGRQMDEIFGVTNNKQGADRLSEIANSDWEDYAEEGETTAETRERLENEDFPTFVCLSIKHKIDSTINTVLLDKVKEIGEYTVDDDEKERKRHDDTPERFGTKATKDRQEEGKKGESDDEEDLDENEKEEQIRSRLQAQGLDKATIEEVTGDVIDHGLKYSFVEKPMPGSEIFSVEPTAGVIIIGLNNDHLAFEKLFSSLDLENDEEFEGEEALEKLEAANTALKLLLEAWARLEDEATGEDKHRYRDIRSNWGKIARDFLYQTQPPE